MQLPDALRLAIDDELASRPAPQLAAAAAELSARYRAGQPPRGGAFLRSADDAAAYAAVRMPATFAAASAALAQLQEQRPAWRPGSLFDVGAGPGTVMWAASALWPDVARVSLLERDPDMMALGKRLAAHSSCAAVRDATWVRGDLTGDWQASPQDLVTISYALGELPEARAAALIDALWRVTSDTLVIVEPGTPDGFARIRAARTQLLAAGAQTIAPCPHDAVCPIAGGDWCHFAQRVARSRLHRQVKGADLAYEDEKFSFMAVARSYAGGGGDRVIRHPQIRKGHIRLELCTPEGLVETVVTRKDRSRYKAARDARWGGVMPSPSASPSPGDDRQS